MEDQFPYAVPAESISYEYEILGSRFIGQLFHAENAEKARRLMQEVRSRYKDATHTVPAFVIGGGNTRIDYCSDDGEPSGTAGRPVLTVLKNSGLGDALITITRYFGGTLLGTGGLVKAYTQGAQELCIRVKRARLLPVKLALLALPYSLLEPVRMCVNKHQGLIRSEAFAEDITLEFLVPQSFWESFNRELQNLSAGELQAELMEEFIQAVPEVF